MLYIGSEKVMPNGDPKKLEEFYNSLNEQQKQRVEDKLKHLLRETYDTLPEESVRPMRWQVASDMYQILKG